jgi:hypothetical protein
MAESAKCHEKTYYLCVEGLIKLNALVSNAALVESVENEKLLDNIFSDSGSQNNNGNNIMNNVNNLSETKHMETESKQFILDPPRDRHIGRNTATTNVAKNKRRRSKTQNQCRSCKQQGHKASSDKCKNHSEYLSRHANKKTKNKAIRDSYISQETINV